MKTDVFGDRFSARNKQMEDPCYCIISDNKNSTRGVACLLAWVHFIYIGWNLLLVLIEKVSCWGLVYPQAHNRTLNLICRRLYRQLGTFDCDIVFVCLFVSLLLLKDFYYLKAVPVYVYLLRTILRIAYCWSQIKIPRLGQVGTSRVF